MDQIIEIGIFLSKIDSFYHFLFIFAHNTIFFMEKQGYNNRIRVILADRQVTNRTLADMLGVSPMTVSRWVTNRYQPSMSQFVEISKMLNVDIRELIEVDPLEISGDVKTETSARKQYPPLEN